MGFGISRILISFEGLKRFFCEHQIIICPPPPFFSFLQLYAAS